MIGEQYNFAKQFINSERRCITENGNKYKNIKCKQSQTDYPFLFRARTV